MRSLLLVSTLTFVFLLALAMGGTADTITVARDGSGDERSIGDAIDNMSPGDDIFVKNGTYFEALEIMKTVKIEGESAKGVIVDANQTDTPIVLSSVDGSILRNLTVMNGTSGTQEAGLSVFNTDGIWLENIIFRNNNASGLLLYGSSDILVNDSRAYLNGGDGITIMQDSFDINLTDTETFNNTRDGMSIRNSQDVFLTAFETHDNGRGMYVVTALDVFMESSVIMNNTNYGIYASGSKVCVFNTTVKETDDFWIGSGFIAITNCSLDSINVTLGLDGLLYIKEFVHVGVKRKESAQSGVDINATENGQTAYASEGYGGTDPKTDASGLVSWIPLGYRYIDEGGDHFNKSHVGASYRGWSEDRKVNMSEGHTEWFNYTGSTFIFVDQDNAGDPSMNGTEEHPFDTIMKAVENASAWDMVRVYEGEYWENVSVNITLTMTGNATDTVIKGALEILSNGTRTFVTDIAITGTEEAVLVRCSDVEFDNVFVTATETGINVTGSNFTLTESHISADEGIHIYMTDRITLISCDIEADSTGLVLNGSDGIWVNDTTIGDFSGTGIWMYDSGLHVAGSNIEIGTALTNSAALDATASVLVLEGTTLISTDADSIVLVDSVAVALNCTFDGNNVSIDADSYLSVRNYLDMYVNKTSGDDVEGADVNVTVDGTSVYATEYFNGTDPLTDANGMVSAVVVENHVFDGTNVETWRNVTVSVRYAPSVDKAWQENRTIDMNTSHVENFTYTAPVVRKPWTEIDTPVDEVSEDVTIDFTLFDKDSDDCTVYVEFSIDGFTFLAASLQGGGSTLSSLSSSPEGVDHDLVWRSALDVPDEDIDLVTLRLMANDTKEGYTNYSDSFHLDNDLNRPVIDIDPIPGEQKGNVWVYFNITDPEARDSMVYVAYHYNGSWHRATKGGGSNTSSNMKTNASGEAYVFRWKSGTDLDGVDDSVTFRIIGNDGGDDNDNGTPDEITIQIDNNAVPDVDIQATSIEKSGIVAIEIELTDEESDEVDLIIMYRLDEGDDFVEAKILDSLEGLESSPSGITHFLDWDSEFDIGEIETETAEIKIFAYDTDEGVNDTAFYHVDNDLDTPEIFGITLPDDLYGDIDVEFTISDDQSADAHVTIKYMIDSGTQKSATIGSPYAVGSQLRNLETSEGGLTYNFTWNSLDDLGKLKVEKVTLILMAEDGPDTPDRSEDYTEGEFIVKNHLFIPRVLSITASGTRKDITVSYRLADIDGEDADVTVQYSSDDGDTWNGATMAEGGDGTADLATSGEGVLHHFIWDSFADLPNATATVLIRIQASNSDQGDFNVSDGTTDVNNILNVRTEIQNLEVLDDHADIRVSFEVRDGDDDHVNVTLWYDYGGYMSATLRESATDLQMGTAWRTHEIVWDSLEDLGYIDVSGLELQLRISDGQTSNKTSTTFDLSNGQIPRITIDSIATSLDEQDILEGMVFVNFTLKDDQSDDCDVSVQYSSDDGTTFEDAALDTYNGEDPDDMFSSISGEEHSFVWDALMDLGDGDFDDILLRLQADDGERNSLWVVSAPFDLDNGQPVNEEPEYTHWTPAPVNDTDDIVIMITVEDDTEDITVTLFYRMIGGADWTEVEMDEDDGVHEATIPNSEITENSVEYYIEIDDGDNLVSVGDADDPKIVTVNVHDPTDTSSEDEETDVTVVILLVVVVGGGLAGGLFFFMKKKGGGGAQPQTPPAGGPPARPGYAPPQGHAPPQQGGQAQVPQGGAQMSVCPVCGAPVMVPPQRPVTVSCNRCNNTFNVN